MNDGTSGGLSLDAKNASGILLDAGTSSGLSLDAETNGGVSSDARNAGGISLDTGTGGGPSLDSSRQLSTMRPISGSSGGGELAMARSTQMGKYGGGDSRG